MAAVFLRDQFGVIELVQLVHGQDQGCEPRPAALLPGAKRLECVKYLRCRYPNPVKLIRSCHERLAGMLPVHPVRLALTCLIKLDPHADFIAVGGNRVIGFIKVVRFKDLKLQRYHKSVSQRVSGKTG